MILQSKNKKNYVSCKTGAGITFISESRRPSRIPDPKTQDGATDSLGLVAFIGLSPSLPLGKQICTKSRFLEGNSKIAPERFQIKGNDCEDLTRPRRPAFLAREMRLKFCLRDPKNIASHALQLRMKWPNPRKAQYVSLALIRASGPHEGEIVARTHVPSKSSPLILLLFF